MPSLWSYVVGENLLSASTMKWTWVESKRDWLFGPTTCISLWDLTPKAPLCGATENFFCLRDLFWKSCGQIRLWQMKSHIQCIQREPFCCKEHYGDKMGKTCCFLIGWFQFIHMGFSGGVCAESILCRHPGSGSNFWNQECTTMYDDC